MKLREKLTPKEHAIWMLKWHDQEPQVPAHFVVGPSREWCRQWVEKQIEVGFLTMGEAQEALSAAGYPPILVQAPLFAE